MPAKKSSVFKPGKSGVVEEVPSENSLWWISAKNPVRRVQDEDYEKKYYSGYILKIQKNILSLYPGEWLRRKGQFSRLLGQWVVSETGPIAIKGSYDAGKDEINVSDGDVSSAGNQSVAILLDMARSAVKHRLI